MPEKREVPRMSILETDRLRLREMTLLDAELLLEIFQDPIAMRHYPSTIDRQGAIAWVERAQASYRQHGHGFWLAERREDGRFLGQCGLLAQDVHGAAEVEVAYLFARRFWGHGYATEAAGACRDWAFTHLAVPRVVSLIRRENLPSIRVAERNGMRPVSLEETSPGKWRMRRMGGVGKAPGPDRDGDRAWW
jgi:RimJ/RimL family protein N-acetyltransferase